MLAVKGEEANYAGEKCQGSPFLTIALIITSSLRMQAINATFFSLPRFNKDW